MSVNSYPEKKIIPYQKTSVSMSLQVIPYLQSLTLPTEVKRATYIIFRNESGGGASGINNNYIGAQADSGRWSDKFNDSIVGIAQKKENKTGKLRLFLAFSSFKTSVDMMADRVQARGLFIGGTTHKILIMSVPNVQYLCVAYQREWVKGEPHYNPTDDEMNNFIAMYEQSRNYFK